MNKMKKEDLKNMVEITTESINIYEEALTLATKDISKFLSQFTIMTPEEVKDYYILQAKKDYYISQSKK